jgi:serine/threonine-protein kinase
MGEVYRAHDTRLKRHVAIKALPEEFSRQPDRVARFEREAEVLASLNHANIAAIYELEESDDSRFLVMELVDGETLAERLARGPMPRFARHSAWLSRFVPPWKPLMTRTSSIVTSSRRISN